MKKFNIFKNHPFLMTFIKFLILVVCIFPIIYFSSLRIRRGALIEGRIMGHCDFACFMIESEFGFIDDNTCWCDVGNNHFMYIPFDLEELFSSASMAV